MKTQEHIDGIWETTEYFHRGHKIWIKSRKGKGIKAHAFNAAGDKVMFTLRYYFIAPGALLKKTTDKIDLLISKSVTPHA